MADEEVPGATAVADSTAPIQLDPIQAVPSEQQEQEALQQSEEAAASGAAEKDEAEEGDPKDRLLALVELAAEGDPEVAAALKEKYGITEEKVADQLLGMETDQVRGRFAGEWTQAYQVAQAHTPAAIGPALAEWFGDLDGSIQDEAKELGIS
mgnify:FL=1